ncbi:hypothetical protein EPIB1_435 [Tritonibacter mobilis]|nr:hypothetical protein EPIB1_435 [Tritonibacter mobilis]
MSALHLVFLAHSSVLARWLRGVNIACRAAIFDSQIIICEFKMLHKCLN